MKPTHIALICNYELLPERIGGMDYFFWAFNKKCKEHQIEIDWFFPNKASHVGYDSFKIIPAENTSVEQHFIQYISTEKVQYTHIITHFVELCTSFFAEIKKHQNSKVIAVDHNPRPLGGYSLKKRLKKRVKGLLYAYYIDLFVGVSAYTSQAILNDFGSFLKPKIQTIYNGVLIEDIIQKSDERRKIPPKFLVVSHLRYSKGIQDLIAAVHLVTKELKSDLEIDVYGDGPYKDELMRLVSKYKVSSNLNFLGSHSNVKKLYQQYDYLIQPTHMECFSLSILESLAANVPVITTPVGGNLEVVTNNKNGFIFKPKDVTALASLLTSLLNGEKRIEGNTRSLIEHKFSIEKMVQQHLEVLI